MRAKLIGVFYQDRQWRDKWFEDFLSKVNKEKIQIVYRGLNNIKIALKNGSYVKSVFLTDNSRGHRMDVIYLDPKIEDKIFYNVVIPLVIKYDKNNIYRGFYEGQFNVDQEQI